MLKVHHTLFYLLIFQNGGNWLSKAASLMKGQEPKPTAPEPLEVAGNVGKRVQFSTSIQFSLAQFNTSIQFSLAQLNTSIQFSLAQFNTSIQFNLAQFNTSIQFSLAQFNTSLGNILPIMER